MKKKKLILIILILLAILATGTLAYGVWIMTNNETKIKTGEIIFNFKESNTNIEIENSTPITDEEGKTGAYFEFSVESTATNKTDIGYYIYLTLNNENTIAMENVKIYLTKVNENGEEEQVKDIETINNLTPFNTKSLQYQENSINRILYSSYFEINSNEEKPKETYRIRFWLDEDSSETITTTDGNINISSKTFKLNVNIIGTNEKPKEISK